MKKMKMMNCYMGRSMYSNTGHFRNIALDTNSVTDLIHCMDGY